MAHLHQAAAPAAKVDGVKEQQAQIKEKIEKLNGYIKHLEGQIRQRKTHGGKRTRARRNSFNGQIISTKKNIKDLEKKLRDLSA